MGALARLRNIFRRPKDSVSMVQLVQKDGTYYLAWSGNTYDSDIVRACVRPKVKGIGKLLAKHVRETVDEDGHKDITINPNAQIRMLLEEPNAIMTGQMLQEKMAMQLCLNNNAFALIVRDQMGIPTAIYPIDCTGARAKYSDSGELYLTFTMKNGKLYTFPYSDIIHLRQDYCDNDIFGTPIMPALYPLLNVVSITDQGVINAIKNSSIIRWLLEFSNAMRPEDLKTQAKDFAANFLEAGEGTGVAAVDSKAKATQINPTDYVPNASQMDRTTKRIYHLFNTNENIVSSDFTEEQYNSYFDAEIEPIEVQLQNEFTRKLFTRRERGFGNRIVFEAGAWDSASNATKLNLLQMVDRGAMTPNEWRATFNLAPLPGGDDPIRRLDTATVADGNTTGEGGTDNE